MCRVNFKKPVTKPSIHEVTLQDPLSILNQQFRTNQEIEVKKGICENSESMETEYKIYVARLLTIFSK
ncbi:hypothetical protein V1478_002740 [Vespula squamosa]|uniref:Uncharacterized protein n=1 Tax=Vespula squamosa TaxID=30214 RepID=A0ABD2BSH1_VESSQ